MELNLPIDSKDAQATILHWRQLAREQADALAALKRRPAVRAALALDRLTLPARARVAGRRDAVRRWLDRAEVRAGGMRMRHQLDARRAGLQAAIAALPPAPHLERTISVVRFSGERVGEREVVEPELLCFLAPTIEPVEDGWLARLAAAISDDTVAATPLVVHPERPPGWATRDDLRVRVLGIEVSMSADGVPEPHARSAGGDPSVRRTVTEILGTAATCLVVDRAAFEAVGGFDSLHDVDAMVVDLCARLRAVGGRVVVVPDSLVTDRRPVPSPASLASPITASSPAWHDVVDRHGPALARWAEADDRGTTFVITVAAPSEKMAPRWGDWHLAQALARSLRRAGHHTRVQTLVDADSPAGRTCDVHVVLRGRAVVARSSGQRHVLWIISHPEEVGLDECEEADLIFVASDRFAAHLRAHTSTPVEVLLQATDERRFRPVPIDPRHAHAVAVVAKTRDVPRPAVADALAAGLRPAIYGTGWEAFVPPELVVTDYVANEQLPAVYSSVGVLLNDHWGTMRDWGFVSNRVFDALACGAVVVSDDLPEIGELFGDAAPTYRRPEELRRLVDAALADPEAAHVRAAAGRERVLAAHTFDHRARALLDALARHGLDGAPEDLHRPPRVPVG